MDLTTATTRMPFRTTADGTIRIGKTRVSLDTLIGVFKNGATPEEIVYQFPVLDLGDVYVVIGFYLQHQETVEQYLQRQTAAETRSWQDVQTQFPQLPAGLRQQLLKRRAVQKPTAP